VSKIPKLRRLLLPLILFVPFGLVMDLAHESGHVIWGVAIGGRLTYMKIAYLEIYPRLALTSDFALGYVRVEGLATEFAYGLFLLGGSVTTNIVSWLLALVLLRMRLGSNARIGLRILGLFGLTDLPFYVLLPQMGLRHWILLGGEVSEPFVGARMIGMPDTVFCAIVLLSTLGLVILYLRPVRIYVRRGDEGFVGSVSHSLVLALGFLEPELELFRAQSIWQVYRV